MYTHIDDVNYMPLYHVLRRRAVDETSCLHVALHYTKGILIGVLIGDRLDFDFRPTCGPGLDPPHNNLRQSKGRIRAG